MRFFLSVGCLLMATLAVVLVLSAAPAAETQADESVLVRARVPAKVPDKEKNRPNPVKADFDTLQRGAKLFKSQCAMCHGISGDGRGDLAKSLKLSMPSFADPPAQKARTDGELFWVLTHGHGSMQGEEGRMSEEYRWALVHHIRTLDDD